MDDDLKVLENKLANLIRLFDDLHLENIKLRSEIVDVKQESAILKQNMLAASERIEKLMQSLP